MRDEKKIMGDLKTKLIAPIGALLVVAASAITGWAIDAKLANSESAFKSNRQRIARVVLSSTRPLIRVDRTEYDPDSPAGYSLLGIANIDGRRIAVYVFRNGAKVDDDAGRGQGSADVYDRAGRLIRRFSFKENRNSPPQITQYVFMPAP
jgi:hypothetical protein